MKNGNEGTNVLSDSQKRYCCLWACKDHVKNQLDCRIHHHAQRKKINDFMKDVRITYDHCDSQFKTYQTLNDHKMHLHFMRNKKTTTFPLYELPQSSKSSTMKHY